MLKTLFNLIRFEIHFKYIYIKKHKWFLKNQETIERERERERERVISKY